MEQEVSGKLAEILENRSKNNLPQRIYTDLPDKVDYLDSERLLGDDKPYAYSKDCRRP